MSREARTDAQEKEFDRFLDLWSRRQFVRNMGAAAAFSVVALGGLEFLEACGNATSSTTGTGGTPKKGGHITELMFSDMQTFNTTISGDDRSTLAQIHVYDGLYTINAKAELYPLIAKDLPKLSADGLTYTIKLRDNVKWTDGKALTSEDVLFTYQLMWDPKYKKVNSPRRSDLEEYVESITAPDATTIVFKTKKVYAPFATAQLQYGILPKSVYGSLTPEEINSAPANSAPTVTSGAFKFVSWKKGEQVTFARNENYYRGAPYLDQYILKIVASSTAILDQLKTGEGDRGDLDAATFDNAKGVDSLQVYSVPQLSFVFYLYQLDKAKSALFQQREVRQALLLALDRKAIAKAIYFNQATVANTSMPPASWAYNKDNKPVFGFEKAKAESLLDAAGWKKGADGIRADSAGNKLKFEMLTNAGNKVRENILVNMQQVWKDIGVDATPKFVDFNKVLVPALKDNRNFQLLLIGFGWGVDPDQSSVFHSRNAKVGGFNGMSYKSAELDKVLDDAVSTLDQKKRKEAYFKMQQIIAEDQPAPVLLFNNLIVGVNKRVNGVVVDTFSGRRTYLKDMWVSDGK